MRMMGEVIPLFDKDAAYHGTCLGCGNAWRVTKEQLDVALGCGILYSPCCKQPATIAKVKRKPITQQLDL
jgi:hypothetical protein